MLLLPPRAIRRAAASATALALTTAGLAAGTVLAPAASAAPSTGVVISQVYGGGGNSGATFNRDYVQLTNRGTTAVDVSTWSVQYASAAGTSYTNKTNLVGSIAPGATYLVGGAAGTTGAALPAVQADGAINLSGSQGKVALVGSQVALTCAAACAGSAGVVDFLGYGTANDSETSPVGALSNTTAALRTTAADTDDNATDFTVGAPAPAGTGGGTTPPPVGAVDCAATPAAEACTPGTTTVQDVQGSGFLSPLAGQVVTRVPGVVTAVRDFGSARGYWLQQPTRDAARPGASSGVFVFTGATSPAVAVGDSVLTTGTVSEFYPGGVTGGNLSVTQVTATTTTKVAGGATVPAALALTPTTVPTPYAATPVSGGTVETITTVDPGRSAQEFYEAHEGEVLSLTDARVVGPSTSFGEVYLTSKPAETATPRGGTSLPSYAGTPTGRIKVESLVPFATQAFPVANTGDTLTGTTAGPLDYDQFGGYGLQASRLGTVTPTGPAREVTATQATDQLAVATYNVENLSPADPQAKFDRLAAAVVTNLASPDVVTLEEIQDDNGPTNDAVVSADATLRQLVAAITAAGGPTYRFTDVDPVDDQDGGQPGGNIRNAFLWNADRVTFVERPATDDASTSAVGVTTGSDGRAHLTASPGRVAPTDPAWRSSRKPLAGEFTFQGQPVIVVANHFNSKGGDQSADGRFQPPDRSSEVQRTQQAAVLNGFVRQVLAADAQANVVLAGDFNDYQFSAPVLRLTDSGATLTDLIGTLPENERYTYVFNGVSQVLDHILLSKPVEQRRADAVEYDVVHVNAEYADQASDHDPQVVRLRLAPVLTAAVVATSPVQAGQATTVSVSGFGTTAGTPVTVALDGTTLGTLSTDATGSASGPVTVPAATTPGTRTLTATAGDRTASTQLTVTAAPAPVAGTVLLTPSTAKAGGRTVVTLAGWAPGATVALALDRTQPLTTVTVDQQGRGVASVVVPALTPAGPHTVTATVGALRAEAALTVAPTTPLERFIGLLEAFLLRFFPR